MIARRFFPLALWIAAFVAVPAGIFALGRWLAAGDRLRPADAPGRSGAKTRPPGLDGSKNGVREPVSGFLGQLRRAQSLETLSLAEIQRRLRNREVVDGEFRDHIRRWAERDPAAAWNFLLTEGRWHWEERNSFHRDSEFAIAMLAYFRKDPEAALEALRAVGATDGVLPAWEGADALLNEMLRGDGPLAAKALPHFDELMAWAPPDDRLTFPEGPKAEIARRIAALPAGVGRTTLLRRFAAGWFSEAGDAAADWARTLPDEDRKAAEEGLLSAVLKPDGSSPPVDRLTWAAQWLSEPAQGAQRAEHGAELVEKMAAQDFDGAWAWATQNLAARPLVTAIGRLIDLASDADRPKAMALVEALPPGGIRQHAIETSVNRRLRTDDPAAVAVWAHGQGLKAGATSRQIASAWAEKDAEQFMASVRAQPDLTSTDSVQTVLPGLIRKAPDQIESWVTSLPQAMATQLHEPALMQLAAEDPGRAAAWLQRSAVPLDAVQLSLLIGHFARKDLAAAEAWAAQLPAGPLKTQALGLLSAPRR